MTDNLSPEDLPQPEFEGMVATDHLSTDGANPNEMDESQFSLLVDRMAENGWLGGPIVTDMDGLIADGEHRWRAAQENNLSEVPVRQFDIDDATRRLWRQELNKIHGEHDSKRDALEYDELLSQGFSEEVEALTDAAGEDLDELLAELRMDRGESPAYDYDPDHSVWFEDCVEGMRERLDDDSVDMVFTSPPYNIDKGSTGGRQSETVDYEDGRSMAEFKEFLGEVMAEIDRVVKDDGHIFVNLDHDWTGCVFDPSTWLMDITPTPCRGMVAWTKASYFRPHYPDRGQFQTNWEPIYHFSNDPKPLNSKKASSVWEVHVGGGVQDSSVYGEHPAPYPEELPDRAIKIASDEGDTILDPFMGSGTTAVAAIRNDRDYVGFELDVEGAYQPIIERRIGEAKRQREASVNAEADADD
jgi:DNA modification methylase